MWAFWVEWVVRVASRKLPQRPPCKEMALRIWTSPTCWMMSPSTTSKESSSVLAAARSGRCQPGGGGGRRKRRGGAANAGVGRGEGLDDVKGVQFGPGGGEVWEVPAWRRRWAAEAAGRRDQGVALEDVGDGGTAGEVEFIGALGAEGAEDGHRAILPQGIMLAEVVAQGEDALDHFGQEGVWRAKRAARAVSKIHTVQTLPGGALHPVLDVGPGQAGLASDLAQGDTAAGQEDQAAALSLREFFKEQTLASACFAVSFVPAPLRSASTTLTAKQELLMSV